jgi:hypothetical protein
MPMLRELPVAPLVWVRVHMVGCCHAAFELREFVVARLLPPTAASALTTRRHCRACTGLLFSPCLCVRACPDALVVCRACSASSSLLWLLTTITNAMRCPYKEQIRPRSTNGSAHRRAQPLHGSGGWGCAHIQCHQRQLYTCIHITF